MIAESLITYFHFLGIMSLFAALIAQHLLSLPRATPQQLKRLFIVDGIYGAAAMLILATGLVKVFWVGKPAAFYIHNGFFHAKMTLFIIVALLSIYPTVQFAKARRASANLAATALIDLPPRIRMVQRIELLLLIFIPLLAVFMART